jgi:nitroimidazol reductase NimA-like FMN-containing flavoprotein (pyridoxamine 5'-phosphate oxidase superfamily)
VNDQVPLQYVFVRKTLAAGRIRTGERLQLLVAGAEVRVEIASLREIFVTAVNWTSK